MPKKMSQKDFKEFCKKVIWDKKSGCFRWRKGFRVHLTHLVGKPVGTYNAKSYLRIDFKGISYAGHRIIWRYHKGNWPKGTIDHIDGNTRNNRVDNLRDISLRDNCLNKKIHRDGKIPGARFRVMKYSKKPWVSEIGIGEKTYYLGLFKTKEEAHKEYLKAKKQIDKGDIDGFLEKFG